MTEIIAVDHEDDHDHDHLPVVRLTRRRAIGLLGGIGAAVLAGCATKDATVASDTAGAAASPATTAAVPTTTVAASAVPTTVAAAATTVAVPTTVAAAALPWLTPPTEIGGPFPADGSNQNGAGGLANVLDKPAVFRTDMTTDLDGSNRVTGIPLALRIKVGHGGDRSPFAGAAVYVWHCDVDGHYSAYSGGMNGGDYAARSYLRAVGVTDADGTVRFTSVLPGRYQGRASHIHFAVFSDRSLAKRLLTSQFAFDDAEVDALYGTNPAYAGSLRNPTYNNRDNVFRDGVADQLLDVTGTASVDAAINILV